METIIAGLSDKIESMIIDNVAPYFVWPHKTPIPFVPLLPTEEEWYLDESPKGLLRVHLVSAKDLSNLETLGTSDP